MDIKKKELPKGQVELTVQIPYSEFAPFIELGAQELSQHTKVQGFRPGKANFEVMKNIVGEMAILEEAANIMIHKQADDIIAQEIAAELVAQPQVNLTKLAAGNEVEYKIIVNLLPTVTLDKYKDLGIKLAKAEVGKEEIAKLIDNLLAMRAKESLADRAIINGDKVVIDMKMYLDKVPLEGGQASDFSLIIGGDQVVPGFDRHLVGATAGETREFDLVMPADHFQKNVAGKKINFVVNLKSVYQRELPKLDDEFVKNFNFKDVAELEANVAKSIQAEKDRQASEIAERTMFDRLIKQAKFSEIPDVLINNEQELMLKELEADISGQGAKFEDYLANLKKTREQLKTEMSADALKRVQAALIVRQVAQAAKVELDQHTLEHELEHQLSHYQDNAEAVKHINSPEYRRYLGNQLLTRQVVEELKRWNIA